MPVDRFVAVSVVPSHVRDELAPNTPDELNWISVLLPAGIAVDVVPPAAPKRQLIPTVMVLPPLNALTRALIKVDEVTIVLLSEVVDVDVSIVVYVELSSET